MLGRFVALREDPDWADIEEGDGSIRGHPVLWLRRPEEVWSPATHEEKSGHEWRPGIGRLWITGEELP
jgi:hypothetical protein